jgi:transposase-like protein
LADRILSAELNEHLAAESGKADSTAGAGNHHNGSNRKAEVYGIEASPQFVSTVTDAVLDEFAK